MAQQTPLATVSLNDIHALGKNWRRIPELTKKAKAVYLKTDKGITEEEYIARHIANRTPGYVVDFLELINYHARNDEPIDITQELLANTFNSAQTNFSDPLVICKEMLEDDLKIIMDYSIEKESGTVTINILKSAQEQKEFK